MNRRESFGQRLFDHHRPLRTRGGGSGNVVALYLAACRETHSRASDCIAYGLEGFERRFVGTAQDKTDVRMSDEPTGSIQHEGEAALTHLDGRYHVPDQLEVDFGDHCAE